MGVMSWVTDILCGLRPHKIEEIWIKKGDGERRPFRICTSCPLCLKELHALGYEWGYYYDF